MKPYNFLNEFAGTCAAGITGYESLATSSKPLTSKPLNSFLKLKRRKQGSSIKKTHTRSKLSECINLFCKKYINENWNPDYDDKDKNEYGEKWKTLSKDDPIYTRINNIVKKVSDGSTLDIDRYRHVYLGDIHIVNYDSDQPHYMVRISGGANGGGPKDKLLTYIKLIYNTIKEVRNDYPHTWFVDWGNDCCDDVWDFRFCFDKQKVD